MLPLKQVNLKAFIEGNDMTKYQGVDVDHPRIIEAVKNLVKAGKKTDEIARVVGMPHEVIRKYERDIRESNKKTELPSAYRIFMSSVDEYEAALKIVGSLKHWRKLCECTWFMEGDKPRNFDGLIQWREDMRLRDASLAKRQLVASAKEGDASSSRKLLDISYKEGKEAVVGRPKKVKPKDTKQDDNQSRIEKLHASINHDK